MDWRIPVVFCIGAAGEPQAIMIAAARRREAKRRSPRVRMGDLLPIGTRYNGRSCLGSGDFLDYDGWERLKPLFGYQCDVGAAPESVT
jgi:hypothetical protein